jgi:hypothetical protein
LTGPRAEVARAIMGLPAKDQGKLRDVEVWTPGENREWGCECRQPQRPSGDPSRCSPQTATRSVAITDTSRGDIADASSSTGRGSTLLALRCRDGIGRKLVRQVSQFRPGTRKSTVTPPGPSSDARRSRFQPRAQRRALPDLPPVCSSTKTGSKKWASGASPYPLRSLFPAEARFLCGIRFPFAIRLYSLSN